MDQEPLLEPSATPEGFDLSAARRGNRLRRALRLAAGTLLALALLFWAASLAWEIRSESESASPAVHEGAEEPDSDDLLAQDAESGVPPVSPSDYLPVVVKGWTVNGVQAAPGSDSGVVEGHYVPRDEERSLVTPLVVYAQVDVSNGGADHIGRALGTRYTESIERFTLDGYQVSAGASPDGWSYFIGWTSGDKVYGVDATFRFRVPATGGRSVLRSAAEEMARAVMKHSEGRKGFR